MGGRFILSGFTHGPVLAEFLGLCSIGTRSGLVMRFVCGDLTQANGIARTGFSVNILNAVIYKSRMYLSLTNSWMENMTGLEKLESWTKLAKTSLARHSQSCNDFAPADFD